MLSEDERRRLENWARRRSTAQGLALRARIVLACAQGGSNIAVAARLGVNRMTVGKWRARFLHDRLDGLTDEPRPGVPRTITDAQVEEVVVRTLEEVPEGGTHWSKRELAARVGISPTSVHRIWRAFGLQPWRTETFKISPDPLLVDKIRDVVGLYLAPPDNAVVVCVDEKSQIQALDRTAPPLPLKPGLPARRTHDYTRHGTTTLFAALETATGKIAADACYPRHRHQEFLKFLKKVAAVCPATDLHVVLDNYGTHKHPEIRRWLARPENQRITLHFTPTSCSWLNMAEIFFGIITRQAIRRGSFRSVRELTTAIGRFIDAYNDRCQPFTWTKDADHLLAKIKPSKN